MPLALRVIPNFCRAVYIANTGIFSISNRQFITEVISINHNKQTDEITLIWRSKREPWKCLYPHIHRQATTKYCTCASPSLPVSWRTGDASGKAIVLASLQKSHWLVEFHRRGIQIAPFHVSLHAIRIYERLIFTKAQWLWKKSPFRYISSCSQSFKSDLI